MFHYNPIDDFTHITYQNHLNDKSLSQLLSHKLTHPNPSPNQPHSNLLNNKQNQLITVPIKQYSNKFLRDKKNQQLLQQQLEHQQHGTTCGNNANNNNNKKKQPFPNSHLYHNRKLISQFKKYKGKSQKFKNSNNKENNDFIIYNLLFEKDDHLIDPHRKTIFGSFAQGYVDNSPKVNTEESSCLFEKGWKTSKNGAVFQAKKEVYQMICQKQKRIPQNRRKCKTLTETSKDNQYPVNSSTKMSNQNRRGQKISTSRALQKYSKIIKVNPQHGKIQKMKIKKQLARSLRFESSQRDIQTRQIKLNRKQVCERGKKMQTYHKVLKGRRNELVEMENNKENCYEEGGDGGYEGRVNRTPERKDGGGGGGDSNGSNKSNNNNRGKGNFVSSQVGMFGSGIKFGGSKFRKFSHQIQSNNNKKCITQQKSQHFQNHTFDDDDFQINGWDINF